MTLRQAESELDVIYNFYREITEKPNTGSYGLGGIQVINGRTVVCAFHGNKHYELFTNFLMDACGKNGFPQELTDKEYKEKDGIIVFRGEHSHEYARDLVDSPTYHYGTGSYGEGIYTTDEPRRASLFSHCTNFDKSYVYEYMIEENAEFLSYETYEKIIEYFYDKTHKSIFRKNTPMPNIGEEKAKRLNELIEYVNKKKDKKFANKFIKGEHKFFSNALAVYLGYDVIERVEDYFTNDYLVLNRGVLCVSESEKKKIMKLVKSDKQSQR